MSKKLIIFLDTDLYPGHSGILHDLRKSDNVVPLSKSKSISNKLDYYFDDEGVKVSDYFLKEVGSYVDKYSKIVLFSIYPEYTSRFTNLINSLIEGVKVESYLPFMSKSDFSEFTRVAKNMNSGSLVPKMKVNKGEVDTLKLAELFSKSPSKCVKYQVKGSVPRILVYKGLESFNYINELNEGVISPATMDEYKSVYTTDKVLPQDTLIQYIPEEFGDSTYSKITTKYNEDEGIYWYECSKVSTDINLYNLPNSNSCYYIYVKKLDKDYMSSICQGIHPLVVNELIINNEDK